MKRLKYFFLVTDLGFILYWIITLFQLIPDEFLFKDYKNSIMVSWNWSFLPIDLLISFTGLTGLYLYKKRHKAWKVLSLLSLTLTFCSGLMAISFWAIRKDFDLTWWGVNMYLIIYPLFFLKGLVKDLAEETVPGGK